MTDVLSFEPDDVHSNFKQLNDIIFATGKNYTLTEANKMYSQKGQIHIIVMFLLKINPNDEYCTCGK